MMKPEVLERRCAELKDRLRKQNCAVIRLPAQGEPQTFHLRQAARRLGVSYSTARRLLDGDPGVRRYSAATGEPVFPGTALKRFQRVRMTWVIPRVLDRTSDPANAGSIVKRCVSGSFAHINSISLFNCCCLRSSKQE